MTFLKHCKTGLGLSPLARGNLLRHAPRVSAGGPIPARAGQPCGVALIPRLAGAYPRSRGATFAVLGIRW